MNNALYSIIQYCPNPERFEALNVGVLVFERNSGKHRVRYLNNFSRLKKVFGNVNKTFIENGLNDFSKRVHREFSISDGEAKFQKFASSRSNLFRISPLQPVLNEDLDDELNKLFYELVDDSVKKPRVEQIRTRVNKRLSTLGILPLLDKKPEPIMLPKYGVTIKAEYGYQNGVYNLVDVARFDEAESGLAVAGKMSIEGRVLSETLDKRLAVIGDFGSQPEDYFYAIKEDLARAKVKLYRLTEGSLEEFSRAVNHH